MFRSPAHAPDGETSVLTLGPAGRARWAGPTTAPGASATYDLSCRSGC